MPNRVKGEMRPQATDLFGRTDSGRKYHYSANFEEIWSLRVRRHVTMSKTASSKQYHKRIKHYSHDEIKAGLIRFGDYCRANNMEGTPYVMDLARFLGPDLHFLNPWEFKVILKLPADDELEDYARDNDMPGPGPTDTYYQYRQKLQAIVDQRNGRKTG